MRFLDAVSNSSLSPPLLFVHQNQRENVSIPLFSLHQREGNAAFQNVGAGKTLRKELSATVVRRNTFFWLQSNLRGSSYSSTEALPVVVSLSSTV
jgi:hypothetical protein